MYFPYALQYQCGKLAISVETFSPKSRFASGTPPPPVWFGTQTAKRSSREQARSGVFARREQPVATLFVASISGIVKARSRPRESPHAHAPIAVMLSVASGSRFGQSSKRPV